MLPAGTDQPSELLQLGVVGDGRKNHLDHLGHVRVVQVLRAFVLRVVPRVEAVVRELLADEHALVAMVEEARVVAAVFDGMVVRVDGVEVQLVAMHVANHLHHDFVRTVAVLVVVDVDPVARLRAVADHVGLDHRGHDRLRRSDDVRVRVAAPQTLLLPAEVDEFHRHVERHVSEDARVGDQTDGARTVVIGSRCDRLVAILLAGGGVDVGADDDLLVGHLDALLGGDQVVVRLTALLVRLTSRGKTDGGVELLEPGHDAQISRAVGAAARDALSLATDYDVAFAGNHLHQGPEVVRLDGGEGGDDARVGGREVGDVDLRRRRQTRCVDDCRIELASADDLLARVNGAEDGVAFVMLHCAVMSVVMVVRSVSTSATPGDENCRSNSCKQKQGGQSKRTERCREKCRHGDAPSRWRNGATCLSFRTSEASKNPFSINGRDDWENSSWRLMRV